MSFAAGKGASCAAGGGQLSGCAMGREMQLGRAGATMGLDGRSAAAVG
jgi:hypothetical protein